MAGSRADTCLGDRDSYFSLLDLLNSAWSLICESGVFLDGLSKNCYILVLQIQTYLIICMQRSKVREAVNVEPSIPVRPRADLVSPNLRSPHRVVIMLADGRQIRARSRQLIVGA